MRHKRIHERAKLLDQLIVEFNASRHGTQLPRQQIFAAIPLLFPGSKHAGKGVFKTVFKVSSRSRDLVIKIARPRSLRNDLEAYRKIPKTIRNRYFAKIYWSTRYCLLQKYGEEVSVPEGRRKDLAKKVAQYGLVDVKYANIRMIDGAFKIVDANLTRAKNQGNSKKQKRRQFGWPSLTDYESTIVS